MFNKRLPYEGIEEWLPKVIKIPLQVFPVTMQQVPTNNQYSQGYIEIEWRSAKMTDLRQFKEAVAYKMHSPYVRQILNK